MFKSFFSRIIQPTRFDFYLFIFVLILCSYAQNSNPHLPLSEYERDAVTSRRGYIVMHRDNITVYTFYYEGKSFLVASNGHSVSITSFDAKHSDMIREFESIAIRQEREQEEQEEAIRKAKELLQERKN